VNLYQWVWVVTDTAGETLHVASPQYRCTYGANTPPLCPITMCKDEECQYCDDIVKPKNLKVTDEQIQANEYDVAKNEGETNYDDEYEENVYTGVYETTKNTMVGTYSAVEGFFGIGTANDVDE
jgi:hypothetical protein